MSHLQTFARRLFFNNARSKQIHVQHKAIGKHSDFKKRYTEIGTKRLIVHNYKNTKVEQPASFQIDPTCDDPQKTIKLLQAIRHLKFSYFAQHGKHTLQRVYLPADYPDSVTKEYLPFTLYQNIMSVCSMAMGFLSTQSLFVALGGGSTESQLAAAAYTWVLKDAVGQFGGILFAARYGQNFDEDIKKWRFMATLALNISIYIEVMALAFPSYFLLLASTANAGKNICFLLASASRAQINLRFAKRNNVGDISGKSVSQFTTSSIAGMCLGSALTSIINVSQLSSLIPTFFVLSCINIYASLRSAQVVHETYLNNSRAALVFDNYFKSDDQQVSDCLLVNAQERFYLPNFLNFQRSAYIRFGDYALIDTLDGGCEDEVIQSLMLQLHKEHRKFTYHVRPLSRFKRMFRTLNNNSRKHMIHINMHKNSTTSDQLHAYHFARLLDQEIMKLDQTQILEAIRLAEREFAKVDQLKFEQALKDKGWALDYIYLDTKRNRYEVEAELIEKVDPSEIPVKAEQKASQNNQQQ